MKRTRFKEVFVFIAGATPQVITETIYALAVKKPQVLPDEICVITTKRGKEAVQGALLEDGILKEMQAEYSLSPIPLNGKSFVVPLGASGDPLEDIRNDEENERMGDIITKVIREKSADPSIRLHCSLAGGRKTMSFYLGAALQLFARPWDRLYHVLVTPEFESNPEFFYKPKRDKIITPPNPPAYRTGRLLPQEGGVKDKSLHTKDAVITLAELPFIRLRDKLTLDGKGFKKLVEEGQKEIDMAMTLPEVRLDFTRRTAYIGKNEVKLAPFHLMIYSAYLKRKLYHCKFPQREYCRDCTDCFPALLEFQTKTALEEMGKDYVKMSVSRTEDLLFKYKEGLKHEVLRSAISKIKKAVGDALQDEALTSLYAIISPLREYANTRHGVRVEKGKIKIE